MIKMIDLSHLFTRETVEIAPGFSVTVREIPHGAIVDLQRRMFGDVSLSGDKRSIQRQLESKKMSPADFNEQRTFLALESWTLKDASGADVPLSLEAWQALPNRITGQIEEVIERLNPTLDDEDKSES